MVGRSFSGVGSLMLTRFAMHAEVGLVVATALGGWVAVVVATALCVNLWSSNWVVLA